MGGAQRHRGWAARRRRHQRDRGAAVGGTAEAAHAATNGKSPMEATLQRIWAQCLGVGSVDRNANFFELGGDSLVAISVAMTAANEGLDLTPQDLYENQTVAALAKALVARYAAGGLARQSPSDVAHPPVPPNVAYFLEHGVRERGQWRDPLILQLRPDVQVEDIRSVLTAVTNHHDALRLRLVERAGTWEQIVGEPQEFAELATRSLPDGISPGSPQEREAVLDILNEQIRRTGPVEPAVAATYVRGVPGGPCYLAISVHGDRRRQRVARNPAHRHLHRVRAAAGR